MKVKHNISLEERRALLDLKKDKTIVIKQADKGGGVVILDRKDYESEIQRQLSDNTSYQRLQHDPTKEYSNILKIILREGLALDYISKDLSDFLLNNHPRVSVFYILPKVHKPGFPPVGRPIVAAQGSLHEPVFKYIDSLLQSFVYKIPSFLCDATDFIKKIEGAHIILQYHPKGAHIISLDVSSLYTNIPHGELRNVLRDILDSREDPHPPTHFLLDLIDILLENNYFRYNSDYYLQTRGVAMGSAFVPSVANLFMGNFKQALILNPLVNPYFQYISNYHRFIDDIFCIYIDPDTYGAFINWLNVLHRSIKFTAAVDQQKVTYLDPLVYRTQGNKLGVRPFKKSTDKNTCTLGHFIREIYARVSHTGSFCALEETQLIYMTMSDRVN